MTKQTGLGRGLSALMGENKPHLAQPNAAIQDKSLLPLELLVPGNFQPRRLFAEENLQDLAESIRKNGVILPIIVRPAKTIGQYEIIAGERRWRASKIAGIPTIPAVIRSLTDKEALEFALIENIQRQDLTPLEEADGYCRLIEEFSYTQEELASRLGKSRSHITNLLRLLGLPEQVKELLHTGAISMGHARALVNVESAIDIANQVVRDGLSVRQVEKLLHSRNSTKEKKAPSAAKAIAVKTIDESEAAQLALALSRSLGMQVMIEEEGNVGKISVYFNGLGQLDMLLQRLGGNI